MAVTSTTTRHSFTGTGASYSSGGTPVGQGPFSINFVIIDATHIQVYWTKGSGTNGTPISSGDFTAGASGYLVKDVHYTVQNAGSGSNASITWVESGFTVSSTVIFPTSNDTIVVTRNVPLTQITNYQNNASIDAETIESSFDKLVQTAQQLNDVNNYSLKFDPTLTGATGFDSDAQTASKITAVKADRANKILSFDSDGDIQTTQEIGTYKGTDATTTTSDYVERDLVKSTTAGQLNNVYICIKDSPSGTALTNATYWSLVVDAVSSATSATTATNQATYASRAEDNAEAYAQTAENTQTTVYADVTSSSTSNDGYSALHHREKSKEFAQTVDAQVTDDSGTANQGYSSKEWAVGKVAGNTDGSSKQWALGGGASFDSGTAVSGSDYSAKEHAIGTTVTTGSAKDWATKAGSAQVASTDFSAKAYASDTANDIGSAKDWATKATTVVDSTSFYSAKEYASGDATGSGGSAKAWATDSSSPDGTSEKSAKTYATEASTSATNASTSATNAASSATAAAASQTAAAASAASAASSYDSFDDRYLGVKSSNPTQDNDGNALVSGALYFSDSANEMRVYDGANWIAATSAGNVSFLVYEYTATASQTTFSGSDDNGASLSYTVGNIKVVMNGVILDSSDFTATSGTSVVLGAGAAVNDLVTVYAYKSFTTADMVPASTGGTFAGNVTHNGDVIMATNKKVKQKGAFMQSSTHQALFLGY